MEVASFVRQNRVWILLGLIILAGFFLRAYHFEDWLHFELDQARDARIIDDGLRGDFWDLPLLGPKAAGTALRLPPGFYYLEYWGALIFGGDPAGQATIVLIFSVLTLGVGYFFLRRYFSIPLTLSLTLLMALSTFFVMYGRFAWNPNLLPFFLILGFYALLRAVDTEEERRGYFLVLAAFSLGLTAHFHFLAFIGVPIITVLFLLIKRPRISWRYWLGTILVVALLFLPLILNEIAAEGRNTEEFFKAITSKSNKGEHTFIEKVVRNTTEQSLGYFLMLTGSERAELPKLKMTPSMDIVCDGGCRVGLSRGFLAGFFYVIAFLMLIWHTYKAPRGKGRDFLLLTLLWFAVTWFLFMNIAFDFSPRFLLLVAPIPFIFLGLLLQLAQGIKWGFVILSIATIVLGATNLWFTVERFQELGRAHQESFTLQGADRILKERARVTLKQQNMIVDYLEDRSKQTGYAVYMHSEPQHRRALKYLMEKRGINNDVLNLSSVYQEGLYFLILRSQSDLADGVEKYLAKYDVIAEHPFGTLTSIEFKPKPESVTGLKQDFSVPEKNATDPHAAPRYTWREWWSRGGAIAEEADTIEERDFTP